MVSETIEILKSSAGAFRLKFWVFFVLYPKTTPVMDVHDRQGSAKCGIGEEGTKALEGATNYFFFVPKDKLWLNMQKLCYSHSSRIRLELCFCAHMNFLTILQKNEPSILLVVCYIQFYCYYDCIRHLLKRGAY